ncbi:hypothetical protein PR048_022417 [Dryococelus australis]|uniref:Uncharacterized protein n=1 Tax=Dryococelus australis TaxID=614101 RepID=A0ABQ9H0Z9_9NEOP|nr:hypothetical protein PR048_022417 [Dryococelus australis]
MATKGEYGQITYSKSGITRSQNTSGRENGNKGQSESFSPLLRFRCAVFKAGFTTTRRVRPSVIRPSITGKKKVMIFVPQDVKTVHHHHVSSEYSKKKGSGQGFSKDEQPLFDSWSISEGHDDEAGHSFGMSGGGAQRGGGWHEGGMRESWPGAQGYIGPPGDPLGHGGHEGHASMQSQNLFNNEGFGDGGAEDIQGTESARHEVRGFGAHSSGQGSRNFFGGIAKGKRYISSGHSSSGFSNGNFGSEQGSGGGLPSMRGISSGGGQGFSSGSVQGFSTDGIQGFSSGGAKGFSSGGHKDSALMEFKDSALECKDSAPVGYKDSALGTKDSVPVASKELGLIKLINLNTAILGGNQGFRNSIPNQKGYSLGSSPGQAQGLGHEGNGHAVGFGAGGFDLSNGDNSQGGYSPGGRGLSSTLIGNVNGHRGYSLGSGNSLSSVNSNMFRVYNSGSSNGPSSGFQESRGVSSGGGHVISSGILGGSHSLEGYSPDSGYATIRGGHHKGPASGRSINGYVVEHVGFGSSGHHHGASSFDDSLHGGFDSDIEEVEVSGWKGIRSGHRGRPSGGGRGRQTSGLRASEEDIFGESDLKAYGSSSRPVTSTRSRPGGRPKKGAHKEGKLHRKGSKNEGRERPKRRPVRFPDDEPRSVRGKRHH